MDQFKSKQLREERANIVTQMCAIRDKAASEDRPMNADEIQQFDRMDADQSRMLEQAEGYARIERGDELKEAIERRDFVANHKTAPIGRVTYQDEENSLKYFLTSGTDHCRNEWYEADRKVGFTGSNQRSYKLPTGNPVRFGSSGVAQSTTTTGGGYLIASVLGSEIDTALKLVSGVRQAAKVIRTATGGPWNHPTADDTMESGLRVAESNTLEEVQSVAFGSKAFGAHKYSSRMVKIPTELLTDSAFDVVGYVAEMLGTRIGRIQNNEFTLLGSTALGPVGLLSAAGGTSAMSTGSTTTTASKLNITHAEIVNMIHTIDPAYRSRPQCGLMFNDGTLKLFKKMVDTQNRPLWIPGVANGEPDTIGGFRYWINTDLANFGTKNNKFLLFGDFSKYLIRDVQDYQLVRLNERYAEYGQVAFVGLLRSDAKLVGPSSCIKYATCGSSTA